jgi:Holliday junction resolvase-like predicted endonuclease
MIKLEPEAKLNAVLNWKKSWGEMDVILNINVSVEVES